MAQRRIKWGILGTSFISQVMANAFKVSSHAELVAIGSRSIKSAKDFADKFSIPKFYDDYLKLLNDNDVEAIYIGLPNHIHKEWIIRCAHAGKHILCEKPFVINPREAHEAIAEVEKSQVVCMEALMYRCHPFTKKLQELVQHNTIGDIKLFNASYTANIANIANPIAGGSIRNLGCYPISLIRLLANAEPVEMQALGRINPKNQNDSQASAILKFDNDTIANVSTAEDIEMFWQFDMYGTRGTIKVITNPWLPDHSNKISIQHIDNKDPVEMIITADKPLYSYQIDSVSQNILNKNTINPQEISLQDSLANCVVLDAWLQKIS